MHASSAWLALAALMVLVLGSGPVRTPARLSLPGIWLVATLTGLLALVVVGRLPRPRPLALVIGSAAVSVVGLVGIFVFHATPAALARLLGLQAAPFVAASWIVATTAIVAAALQLGANVKPSRRAILAIAAVASFAIADVAVVESGEGLRDLRLYLAAGERFLAGLPVYRLDPLSALFADPSQYPFLYPPVTLPVFAFLSSLPLAVSGTAWLMMSVGGAVAALRLLAVRSAWVPVLLLWPPFFEGLWAGNVAVPGLVLLAAGFRAGRWLVTGPLFKVQAAIPALWLLRERRWRELAIGLAIVLAICLLTLPFVGLEQWSAWVGGLRAFQRSQEAFPVLYSFALPRIMPYGAFLIVAIAAAVWALSRPGPEGLARLGLASVVASPSLYRHGLLAALPAILLLDARLVWVALGATVTYWGLWAGVVIAVVGLTTGRFPADPHDPTHPASTPARGPSTLPSQP